VIELPVTSFTGRVEPMDNQARTAPLGRACPYNTRRSPSRFWALAWVMVLLCAAPAAAQDINETVTIEDLGFTRRLTAGARPTALAGAYAAVSLDVHSLIYNPAGLVGVTSPEFDLGFQTQQSAIHNTYFGTPARTDPSATKLDDIAFAIPIPTTRGRLVIAGGVYRAYSSDFEILNRGFNTITSTNDSYLLQQTGSTYSYNFGGAVDLSPRLSVGANLFFLNGKVDALTQFSYEPVSQPAGRLELRTLVDDASVDISGVGGTVGFLYQTAKVLNIGVSVGTPTPIYMRGEAVQDDAFYFRPPPDSLVTGVFAIDADYKLPFYAEAGIAMTTKHLLLSFEAEYTNWAEAEINGRQIKDEDLRAIFKDVIDFRVGAELVLGGLYLRGGYAYTPYPLEYLQADRIDGTQITSAIVQTEPHSYTGGVGLRIADVFRLDASAEYQEGRRSIPTLSDWRDSYRFVFAASVSM